MNPSDIESPFAPPTLNDVRVDHLPNGMVDGRSISPEMSAWLIGHGISVELPEPAGSEIDDKPLSEDADTPNVELTPEQIREYEELAIFGNGPRVKIPNRLVGKGIELLRSLRPGLNERTPTYYDRYSVFDREGRMLYNGEDGPQIDTRKFVFDESTPLYGDDGKPLYFDINGKPLDGKSVIAPYEKAPLWNRMKDWGRTKIAQGINNYYRLEEAESMKNAHESKLIAAITGTGPDSEERIVFNVKNDNGVLRKLDNKPLTKAEERMYYQQMKAAQVNKSWFQGVAAYEIGKMAESDQAEGWLRIANIMWRDLGYDKHEIDTVMIGLQYMKKPIYLTFKHTGLEFADMLDNEGNAVLDSKGNPVKDKRSLVFGKLKDIDYAQELAEKVKVYEMQYSPADLRQVLDIIERNRAIAEKYFWTPELRDRREYLKATLVLTNMKRAIDGSRAYGGGLEPNDDNMAQLASMRGGNNTMTASISAGGTSKLLWGQMSRHMDEISSLFPVIGKIDLRDFPLLSEVK